MTAIVKPRPIVILWTHEIRLAAAALDEVYCYSKKPESEQDPLVFSRLASNALAACRVALFHEAIAQNAPLVVCDDPSKAFKAEPKQDSPEYGENAND